MENASKALIIAAAILLSILIIALGMRVYNNASSSAGSADLSSQEVASHNAQFDAYEGRQKGTQVKTLLNLIAKNNEEYEDRKISVNPTGMTDYGVTPGSTFVTRDAINGFISKIDSNTTYKVEFYRGSRDGLYNVCVISIYQ